MDPQRFDAFTRALASGSSRRSVLKGIVGAAFGGVLVGARGAAAQPVCTAPGGTCTSNDDCCNDNKCSDAGICYCVHPGDPLVGCPCDSANDQTCGGHPELCCPQTGTCASDSTGCPQCAGEGGDCSSLHCCDGLTCSEGACIPASTCANAGDSCEKEDCCDGLTCNDSGVCEATTTCSVPGETCQSDGDCCVGTCSEGVCNCGDPSQPIVGCPCDSANVQTCQGHPDLCCHDTGTCASPMVGCNPTGCAAGGQTCTSGDDCCSGKCSDQGFCYCTDPAQPTVGCPCTQGDANACDGHQDLCCDDGACASPMTGCQSTCAAPGGTCTADSDCCVGSCSEDGVCYCSDPSRPIVGCPCDSANDQTCGGRPDLCCADTGTCTSPGVGCNPTGCVAPGGACKVGSDCCQGTCSEDGVCYCKDPSRPTVGCTCDASDKNACGGNQDLCCDDGTCASPMTGCNPKGGNVGDPCTTGTQNPCNGDLQCCATTTRLGGPGVCTAADATCPPVNGGGGNNGGGNKPSKPSKPSKTTTPAKVTTLPTTGSGAASGRGGLSSWLASSALAGAGAAALAAIRQRRRESAEDQDV